MGIYRGPGGTGESSSNTALAEVAALSNTVLQAKEQAEAAASSASASATASAASAASAATTAGDLDAAVDAAQAAQAASETAQEGAEEAQDAALTAQVAAEAAQAASEAAQAAAEAAASNSVTLTTDQTITGVKTFTQTIEGSINGNAATVTDGVTLSGSQTLSNKTISFGANNLFNVASLTTIQTLDNKLLDGGTF